MSLPRRSTSVVAATDVLAFRALRGAHCLGVRVPGDASIVSFDDVPVTADTNPSLTTVRRPAAEMVAIAVREGLDGTATDGTPERHLIEAELVVGESSGPVPSPAS